MTRSIKHPVLSAVLIQATLIAVSSPVSLARQARPENDRKSHIGITVKGPEISDRTEAPDNDPNGRHWFKRKPRSIDKMKWGWRVSADGVGPVGTTSEPKFDFNGAGANRVPVGKVLDGFDEFNLFGPRGSLAWSYGEGESKVVPANARPYQVEWENDVFGFLGDPDKAPFWEARSNGSDPFYFKPEDLSEAAFPDAEIVDLLFPVGITSAAITGDSSNGDTAGTSFDVTFVMADMEYPLFSFSVDLDGTSFTEHPIDDYPFDLRLHSLDSLEDDIVVGETDTSFSSLADILSNDLADGSLDNPMFLAFDIAGVDTHDLFVDGTQSFLSAASSAWGGESDVPGPGAATLLLLGGAVMIRRQRPEA